MRSRGGLIQQPQTTNRTQSDIKENPMKLYYSPGACSLASHIALREAGLAFELEKVDLRAKKTASGADFLAINSKGYVPALELDNGYLLTEGPAIGQYIADQKSESGLAPEAGSLERYQLQSYLNFITSELHKTIGSLFNPAMPAEWKTSVLALIDKRLTWMEAQLTGKVYLMGAQFTVADAYLFTVLRWTVPFKIDLTKYPSIKDYFARVAARPKVQEAMHAEGLGKH
jgi:glutathione S-transferase